MQTSRNKSQYKGIKHFVYSTKYSFEGIIYGYKNEMSLQLHGILSIAAIIFLAPAVFNPINSEFAIF